MREKGVLKLLQYTCQSCCGAVALKQNSTWPSVQTYMSAFQLARSWPSCCWYCYSAATLGACFESKCHNLLCWCCANCKLQIYPHWNPRLKERRFGAVKNKTKKQNAGRRPERKPKQHEHLGFLWNVSIDPVVALVFHVTFDVYFWVLTGKKQKGNKKASNYICAGFENHFYFLWGGTRSDGMWAGGVGWQVRQEWGRWQW